MTEHTRTCQGLHDPASPACFNHLLLPKGARFVERCDELSKHDDDGTAALAAGLTGSWVECSDGGEHYLVGCTPQAVNLIAL